MRKALLLIIFIWAVNLYAQQETPPLYFEYDSSGNQVISDLVCVNCPDEDIPIHSLDKVSYYPNPVEEQLILTWENTAENRITAVRVYALNGRLMTSRINLKQQDELSLDFSTKAAGIYLVELLSSDGQKRSIKVIKK